VARTSDAPIVIGSNVSTLIDSLRLTGFKKESMLLDFVEGAWNIKVPRQATCLGHSAPADYLLESFFRDSDCVCWANRGGGKTLLGAIASALDSLFKGDCETKVLGGSGEQSLRMYRHLHSLFGDPYYHDNLYHYIDGDILATQASFLNRSSVQILTASSRSVRGPHPQKLKLDEVDEFESDIYQAALLIPISKKGIQASTHIYSTMHRPFGLMHEVVQGAAAKGYKVFKWCIFEVLERCVGRDCDGCELWEDCQGKAREASGYYSIEDAISKKRKVTPATWRSEMLCEIPSKENLIYQDFDPTIHIKDFDIDDFLP